MWIKLQNGKKNLDITNFFILEVNTGGMKLKSYVPVRMERYQSLKNGWREKVLFRTIFFPFRNSFCTLHIKEGLKIKVDLYYVKSGTNLSSFSENEWKLA